MTDVEGVPVIGANILVKGQTTGVISDVEGKFSITVSSCLLYTSDAADEL